MTTLYAQPYDISVAGFYFKSTKEFNAKAAKLLNACGQAVEEFELQFIDGDSIDGLLFDALNVHQGNVGAYLDAVEDWSDDAKIKVLIAVREAGYKFELGSEDPDDLDIDFYECDSLRDLAIQFIDEGLFGDIPERLAGYIDYDAIARDLSADYSQIEIAGARYICRCC